MTTCAFHGADAVCDRCPERFDTDGKGFPHPAVCKGRQALRVCKACCQALALDAYDLPRDWLRCRRCTCNAENLTPQETSHAADRERAQGKFSAVARETEDRNVRRCTRCNANGLRAVAKFVARDDDGLEWFECGEHGERDNVAETVRVKLTPLDEWRRLRGLPPL